MSISGETEQVHLPPVTVTLILHFTKGFGLSCIFYSPIKLGSTGASINLIEHTLTYTIRTS